MTTLLPHGTLNGIVTTLPNGHPNLEVTRVDDERLGEVQSNGASDSVVPQMTNCMKIDKPLAREGEGEGGKEGRDASSTSYAPTCMLIT